jgi:hypothetical protein
MPEIDLAQAIHDACFEYAQSDLPRHPLAIAEWVHERVPGGELYDIIFRLPEGGWERRCLLRFGTLDVETEPLVARYDAGEPRPNLRERLANLSREPPRRGRPRLSSPERAARIEASKRAWRERNAEALREKDRVRRTTDAFRAWRRAAWRERHPPRPRVPEEEKRARHREAVRRYRARARAREEERVQPVGS